MKIEVTDEQKQKMWDEIIKQAKGEVINIPPSAKTKRQFMMETGMTEWEAERFLKLKVDTKELQTIRYKNALYYYPT